MAGNFRRKPKSFGQANRENRVKAIEAYRLIDKGNSARIAGAVHSAFSYGSDDPEFTPAFVMPILRVVPTRHRVPILEPWAVRSNFNRGFESGYNFKEAMEEIRIDCDGRRTNSASIGRISIVGGASRKHWIMADIVGERLQRERRAAERSLGASGMRGFKGHHAVQNDFAQVLIGEVTAHIPSAEQIRGGRYDRQQYPDIPPASQEDIVNLVESQLAIGKLLGRDLPLTALKVKAH